MKKVIGFGNCQTDGMARCAAELLGLEPLYLRDPELLAAEMHDANVVFATAGIPSRKASEIAAAIGRSDLKVIRAPRLYFSGFHPDLVVPTEATAAQSDLPMGQFNSALLLAAWREGLDITSALGLFRDEVYEAVGYYDMFGMATDEIVEECARAGIDIRPLMDAWLQQGSFFYTPNHPKIAVIEDITKALLQLHELQNWNNEAKTPRDVLASQGVWPVYRELGDRVGVPGDYIFRLKRRPGGTFDEAAPIHLEEFVKRTFAGYRRSPPDVAAFARLKDPRLANVGRFRKVSGAASHGNPYKQFGSTHWWSKSVAAIPPEELDPVVETKFLIGKNDRVATAGSCFAQHIAKRLAASGFNYLVTENAPPECCDPVAYDYGAFTARFGNIYTVRQLLQLADRAYGSYEPLIDAWEVTGGYLDPFRPRIGGSPFSSLDELRRSRAIHFAAVREMFESSDVFVFTLGLTEAWVSEDDGAVVPLPPGVLGANVSPNKYVPQNFTFSDTFEDLRSLVRLFQLRNPTVRFIFTVSPVPLIATHDKKHVLEATTQSKSVLRAAAGEIANSFPHVAYFPSYEIITGSFNRGAYFAEDLREVTNAGVNHVMRIFLGHYGALRSSETLPGNTKSSSIPVSQQFRSETTFGMEIVCDEEEIVKAS